MSLREHAVFARLTGTGGGVVGRIFRPENRLAVVATQVFLGIAVWYAGAVIFPQNLMPYPDEALRLTYQMTVDGIIVPHTVATLRRIFWAFLGVIFFGTLIGVLMGTNSYLEKFLRPYVLIFLTMPGIIWALFTLLIFGFGSSTAILLTILAATPYAAIHIWKGVENIRVDLLEMARAFELSRLQILLDIILPNIAPQLFAAFRFGLGLSYKLMIIGEMFAVSNGIGYKLIQTYEAYRFQEAWAWAIVFLAIIIVIEFGIFRRIERRVFEYRAESTLAVGAAE